jgi:imidazole glycerol phosphate synthase subunit HisF
MDNVFNPNEHVSFIVHKGKQVLFSDYTHCKNKWDMIKMLEAAAIHFRQSQDNLLVLIDATNAKGSSEYMDALKKYQKEVFDPKTNKGAVIGVTGLKKVLLQGLNLVAKKKMTPFDSKEEALDYLTAH